ncbi:hypothetical protein [Mesorhizobium sp. M0676]|uniref:hypothetical protein n=1 Tax=Mesorhizobium sp. M0676 TaxID=2956984 RepID=UPI0033388AD3
MPVQLYSEFLRERTFRWPLKSAAKRGLVVYAERLENKNLPVILDMQHLSWHTGIKSQFIANVVLDGARYYRSKVIPKRRGGERILFVPRPFLAGLQRWILDEVLSKLKPHCSAFGFIKGRGIVENAKVHVNSKCVLKVDIKDFFGSVSYVTVYDIFLQAGYSPKISYCLIFVR